MRDIYTDCVNHGTVRAKGFRFICIASLGELGIVVHDAGGWMQRLLDDYAAAEEFLSNEMIARLVSDGFPPGKELKVAIENTSKALRLIRPVLSDLQQGSPSNDLIEAAFTLQTSDVFPRFTELLDLMAAALDTVEKGERERERDLMTDAVKDIDKITGAINLIAINASIEAAHAGDRGRGFAVIANEIQALSKRSKSAIEDIQARIV